MNREHSSPLRSLSGAGRARLDQMSSARRNRLRLAYFQAGAPFGPSETSMALWLVFGRIATVN